MERPGNICDIGDIMDESKLYLSDLPACVMRVGRIWDNVDGIRKAVMACGGMREISIPECIRCHGFSKPMLKDKMKGW